MKKVIYNQFGNANVLEIIEAEIPKIIQDEVLIQVKAVSINPLDWKLFSGSQKMLSGKKFPKMVGIDFSGIVRELGNNNTDFKVGDEVFGAVKDPMKEGVLAEYITIKTEQLTLKPTNISFSQATAMTSVGAPAIKAFEEQIKLKEGQKVLINGASGGVGMIAIQVAKRANSTVTAVSSTKGLKHTKEWGADFVIDYRKEDVSKLKIKYDIILELSGKLTFKQAKNLMTPNAVFITLMGAGTMKDLLFGKISSLFSKRKFYPIIAPATSSIREKLSKYAEKGLKIHIDKTYSIDEVKTAYAEIQKKSIIGKAVISME